MSRLGLLEVHRAPARFVAVLATLTALAFLALFLTGVASGLLRGSTAALQVGETDLVVFADTAHHQVLRSRLPAELVAPVTFLEGVGGVGVLSVLPTTATDPTGEQRVIVLGVVNGSPPAPRTIVEGRFPIDGEPNVAAVDVAFRDRGVQLGDTLTIAEEREVEVIGFVADARLQLQPTVWVPPDTFERMHRAARPETAEDGLTSVLAVRVQPGSDPDAVAARIDAELGETETVSLPAATAAMPGVHLEQVTLRTMTALVLGVATVVVALFWTLLILDKRHLLGTLKALGAGTSHLGTATLLQALAVTAAAWLVSVVAVRLLGGILPADVPLRLDATVLGTVAGALLLATTAGIGANLWRLARIDPASAMGTGR
jgi:putative ABC transport system permease protein